MPVSVRIAAFIALLLVAPPAGADDKARCIAAAEGGQDLRTEGKLRAARDRFVECAAAVCPDAIRNDCARFLAEVQASLPSIVVTATSPDGDDVYEARLLVDGEVVAERLDGKAVPADPGRHIVVVERSGGGRAEASVVLAEGDKNRRVHLAFPRAAANPASSARASVGPSLTAPLIVGGVGLAVLSGSLFLGFSARGEIADLRDTCAPACDEDALDRSRRKLLLADIGIGIGVAAAAAATYLFVTADGRPRASVGARAVPAGGLVSLQAVF